MQSHKLTLDQAVGSELAQKVRDAKEIKSYDMTKEVIREVLEAHGYHTTSTIVEYHDQTGHTYEEPLPMNIKELRNALGY